jgi:cell division protein FtsB
MNNIEPLTEQELERIRRELHSELSSISRTAAWPQTTVPRLLATIDTLKAENAELDAECDRLGNENGGLEMAVGSLNAENERLHLSPATLCTTGNATTQDELETLRARVEYLEDELSMCEICDRSLLVSEEKAAAMEAEDPDTARAAGSVETLICHHCWNEVCAERNALKEQLVRNAVEGDMDAWRQAYEEWSDAVSAAGHSVRTEGGGHDLIGGINRLVAERDALKAENEKLRRQIAVSNVQLEKAKAVARLTADLDEALKLLGGIYERPGCYHVHLIEAFLRKHGRLE